MTKIIASLWCLDSPAALHDPALHRALAEAGATRLQVNVTDDDVAEAMRIATDEQIEALVSLWDGDTDAVLAALGTVAGRVAAYAVEERRPLDPPETWDGSRADTLSNVAVLRRPAELSVEEWRHRWLDLHTQVAIDTQGTFGYLQHPVIEAITDDAPQVDAIVEELFPMAGITDMHAFFGSGGDDAELASRMERLMASVANFGADRDINLVPTSRYLYTLA